ncbi:MAG: putative polyprotein [Tvarminne alphaendornavirus]|nr:MAG: putative polyprotein [Tvarminne alphaendornavirus]
MPHRKRGRKLKDEVATKMKPQPCRRMTDAPLLNRSLRRRLAKQEGTQFVTAVKPLQATDKREWGQVCNDVRIDLKNPTLKDYRDLQSILKNPLLGFTMTKKVWNKMLTTAKPDLSNWAKLPANQLLIKPSLRPDKPDATYLDGEKNMHKLICAAFGSSLDSIREWKPTSIDPSTTSTLDKHGNLKLEPSALLTYQLKETASKEAKDLVAKYESEIKAACRHTTCRQCGNHNIVMPRLFPMTTTPKQNSILANAMALGQKDIPGDDIRKFCSMQNIHWPGTKTVSYTTWSEGPRVYDMMHCGGCDSDLEYDYEPEEITLEHCSDNENYTIKRMGTLIEEMGVMGYLDGAELTPTARQQMIQHDTKKVRLFFGNYRLFLQNVYGNLTNAEKLEIVTAYPGAQLKQDASLIPSAPHYATCKRVLLEALSTLLQGKKALFYVDGKFQKFEEHEQIGRVLNQGLNTGNDTGIMQLQEGGIAIVDDGCQFISLFDLCQLMRSTKRKQFYYLTNLTLVDIRKEEDTMGEDQCYYWNCNGTTKMCLNNTGEVVSYNTKNVEEYVRADFVVLDVGTYHIRTVQVLGMWTMRQATLIRSQRALRATQERPSYSNRKVSVNLPLVKPMGLINFTGAMAIEIVELQVDPTIFEPMFIRNMDNKTSWQALVEYGISIAYQRYNLRDKVIHNSHLTIEQIKLHAYAVTLLSERLYGRMLGTTGFMQPGKPWSQMFAGLKLGFQHAVLAGSMSLLGEAGKSIQKLLSQRNLLQVKSAGKTVDWDLLQSIANRQVWETVSVVTGSATSTPSVWSPTTTCDHHSESCRHEITEFFCGHCLMPYANETGWCVCCTELQEEPQQCDHKRLSDSECDVDHIHKMVMCNCCRIKHCGADDRDCVHCFNVDTPLTEPTAERVVELAKELSGGEVKPKPRPSHTKRMPKIVKTYSYAVKQRVAPKKPTVKVMDKLKVITVQEAKLTGADDSESDISNDEEKDIMMAISRLTRSTSKEYAFLVWEGPEAWKKYCKPSTSHHTTIHMRHNSQLKFIPIGKWTINSDRLRITNFSDTSHVYGECGLAALRAATGSMKLSYDMMLETSGKTGDWDALDLSRAAAQCNLNVIIVLPGTSMITKSVPGDSFGVVIHSLTCEGIEGHWYVGNVEQIGPANVHPNFNDSTSWQERAAKWHKYGANVQQVDWQNVDFKVRLVTENELYGPIDACMSAELMPMVVRKEGITTFVSGNPEDKNPISTVVPDWALNCMELWEPENPVSMLNNHFDTPFDIPPGMPEDHNAVMVDWLKNTIKTMLQFSADLSRPHGKSNSNFSWSENRLLVRTGPNAYVTKTNGEWKLKLLDVVSINFEGTIIAAPVISVSDDMVGLRIHAEKSKLQVGMSVSKTSIASLTYLVHGILTSNAGHLKKLLETAECYDFVAGGGKSTAIGNRATRNSTAMAMTRTAQTVLKQKCKAKRVTSWERAMRDKVSSEELFVDEANMLTWQQMACVVTPSVKRLILYGNLDQVGVIDTSDTWGVRVQQSIMRLCNNVNRSTTCYRIGTPLANALGKTRTNLSPGTGKTTNYRMEYWPEMDYDALRSLIAEENPSTVITFTRKCTYALQKELEEESRDGLELVRAHGFQGAERSVVAVLQWSMSNAARGKHLEFEYTWSAATRANKKLIWISVGCYSPGTPLNVMIEGTESGSGIMVREQGQSYSLWALADSLLRRNAPTGDRDGSGVCTLTEEMGKPDNRSLWAKMLGTERELENCECGDTEITVPTTTDPKELLTTLQRVIKAKTGKDCKVTDNKLDLGFLGDLTVGQDRKVTINDKWNMLPADFAKNLEQLGFEVKEGACENCSKRNNPGSDGNWGDKKTVDLPRSIRNDDQMRVINHTLSLYQGYKVGWRVALPSGIVVIKAVSGCSYCMGILVRELDQTDGKTNVLLLHGLYNKFATRKMDFNGSKPALVAEALCYMGVSEWNSLAGVASNLENVPSFPISKKFNGAASLGILLERISQLPGFLTDKVKSLVGMQFIPCHHHWKKNNTNYEVKRNSLEAIGWTVRKNFGKYWGHMSLSSAPLACSYGTDYYAVIVTNRGAILCSLLGDSPTCKLPEECGRVVTQGVLLRMVWKEELARWPFWLAERLSLSMGSIDGPIGSIEEAIGKLNFSLEWHKENKTGLHSIVASRTSALAVGSMENPASMIKISATQRKKFGPQLSTLGTKQIVEHNFMMLEHSYCGLVEQVMVSCLSAQDHAKVLLMSNNPCASMLVHQWNVCSVPLPGDDVGMLQYMESLPFADKMVETVKRMFSRPKPDAETDPEHFEYLDSLRSDAAKQLELDGPWYSRSGKPVNCEPERVLLGVRACTLTNKALVDIIKSFNTYTNTQATVQVLVPNLSSEDDESVFISKTNGKLSIRYEGHPYEIAPDAETYDCMISGKPFRVREESYRWATINNVLQHGVLELIKLEHHSAEFYTSPPAVSNRDLVMIELPLVEADPVGAIRSGLIIKMKRVKVSVSLMRALSLRAAREGTTWQDILAYVKFLKQNAWYSRTGIAPKYRERIEVAMHTALFVYLNNLMDNGKMQPMIDYYSRSFGDLDNAAMGGLKDLMLSLWQQLGSALFLDITLTDLQEFLETKFELPGDNLFKNWLKTFGCLDFKMVKSRRMLLKWNSVATASIVRAPPANRLSAPAWKRKMTKDEIIRNIQHMQVHQAEGQAATQSDQQQANATTAQPVHSVITQENGGTTTGLNTSRVSGSTSLTRREVDGESKNPFFYPEEDDDQSNEQVKSSDEGEQIEAEVPSDRKNTQQHSTAEETPKDDTIDDSKSDASKFKRVLTHEEMAKAMNLHLNILPNKRYALKTRMQRGNYTSKFNLTPITIYNPEVEGHCFQNCLAYLADLEEADATLIDSLAMLNIRRLVSEADVITILTTLGENILLMNDATKVANLIVNNDTADTCVPLLISGYVTRHLSVVSPADKTISNLQWNECTGNRVETAMDWPMQSETEYGNPCYHPAGTFIVDHDCSVEKVTVEINQTINAEKPSVLDLFKPPVITDNLIHRVARKIQPLITSECNITTQGVMCEEELVPWDYVAVCATDGWYIGIVTPTNNYSQVWVLNGTSTMNVGSTRGIMKLGQSAVRYGRPAKTIIPAEGNQETCLNNVTAKYLSNNLNTMLPVVSGPSAALHIYEYQNRAHHLYDESVAIRLHSISQFKFQPDPIVGLWNDERRKMLVQARSVVNLSVKAGEPILTMATAHTKEISLLLSDKCEIIPDGRWNAEMLQMNFPLTQRGKNNALATMKQWTKQVGNTYHYKFYKEACQFATALQLASAITRVHPVITLAEMIEHEFPNGEFHVRSLDEPQVGISTSTFDLLQLEPGKLLSKVGPWLITAPRDPQERLEQAVLLPLDTSGSDTSSESSVNLFSDKESEDDTSIEPPNWLEDARLVAGQTVCSEILSRWDQNRFLPIHSNDAEMENRHKDGSIEYLDVVKGYPYTRDYNMELTTQFWHFCAYIALAMGKSGFSDEALCGPLIESWDAKTAAFIEFRCCSRTRYSGAIWLGETEDSVISAAPHHGPRCEIMICTKQHTVDPPRTCLPVPSNLGLQWTNGWQDHWHTWVSHDKSHWYANLPIPAGSVCIQSDQWRLFMQMSFRSDGRIKPSTNMEEWSGCSKCHNTRSVYKSECWKCNRAMRLVEGCPGCNRCRDDPEETHQPLSREVNETLFGRTTNEFITKSKPTKTKMANVKSWYFNSAGIYRSDKVVGRAGDSTYPHAVTPAIARAILSDDYTGLDPPRSVLYEQDFTDFLLDGDYLTACAGVSYNEEFNDVIHHFTSMFNRVVVITDHPETYIGKTNVLTIGMTFDKPIDAAMVRMLPMFIGARRLNITIGNGRDWDMINDYKRLRRLATMTQDNASQTLCAWNLHVGGVVARMFRVTTGANKQWLRPFIRCLQHVGHVYGADEIFLQLLSIKVLYFPSVPVANRMIFTNYSLPWRFYLRRAVMVLETEGGRTINVRNTWYTAANMIDHDIDLSEDGNNIPKEVLESINRSNIAGDNRIKPSSHSFADRVTATEEESLATHDLHRNAPVAGTTDSKEQSAATSGLDNKEQEAKDARQETAQSELASPDEPSTSGSQKSCQQASADSIDAKIDQLSKSFSELNVTESYPTDATRNQVGQGGTTVEAEATAGTEQSTDEAEAGTNANARKEVNVAENEAELIEDGDQLIRSMEPLDSPTPASQLSSLPEPHQRFAERIVASCKECNDFDGRSTMLNGRLIISHSVPLVRTNLHARHILELRVATNINHDRIRVGRLQSGHPVVVEMLSDSCDVISRTLSSWNIKEHTSHVYYTANVNELLITDPHQSNKEIHSIVDEATGKSVSRVDNRTLAATIFLSIQTGKALSPVCRQHVFNASNHCIGCGLKHNDTNIEHNTCPRCNLCMAGGAHDKLHNYCRCEKAHKLCHCQLTGKGTAMRDTWFEEKESNNQAGRTQASVGQMRWKYNLPSEPWLKKYAEKKSSDVKEYFQPAYNNITALDAMEITELAEHPTIIETLNRQTGPMIYIEPDKGRLRLQNPDPMLTGDGHVPITVVNLWEDSDLTDYNTKYAPLQDMKLGSRQAEGSTMMMTKTTLVKYPTWSRAVLAKQYNTEFNAVTGRLGSIVTLRKEKINVSREVNNFIKAYFREDCAGLLEKWKTKKITWDPSTLSEWVAKRKDWNTLSKDLVRVMQEGLHVSPLNSVNVHVKQESLLKDNPIHFQRESQGRIIVWQAKVLCGMFSPIFLQVKDRLKQLFHSAVEYTDGLTPSEIAARLRLVNAEGCFENDLTKQDRQTDHEIIDVEFALYDLLGVDPTVLKIWREVHHMWRFKGTETRGQLDAMRLTGQATTAIGNVIVNLIVHSQFVLDNMKHIKLMLVLGDDGAILMDRKPNLDGLRRRLEDRYNMQCKPNYYRGYGTFCCLLLYRTLTGFWEAGPDYVRLCRRYEVTNGGNHVTTESIPYIVINDNELTQYLITDQPVPNVNFQTYTGVQTEKRATPSTVVIGRSIPKTIETTKLEVWASLHWMKGKPEKTKYGYLAIPEGENCAKLSEETGCYDSTQYAKNLGITCSGGSDIDPENVKKMQDHLSSITGSTIRLVNRPEHVPEGLEHWYIGTLILREPTFEGNNIESRTNLAYCTKRQYMDNHNHVKINISYFEDLIKGTNTTTMRVDSDMRLAGPQQAFGYWSIPDVVATLTKMFENKQASALLLRSFSYLMMLGDDETLKAKMQVRGWNIELPSWYGSTDCRVACANKYDISIDEVDGFISNLAGMIFNPQPYHHDYKILTGYKP